MPRYSFALKLSVAYAVAASVWITASDHLLLLIFGDTASLAAAGIYKVLGFVLITSLLLYAALAAQSRRETGVRDLAVTRHFEQLANSLNDSVILLDDSGQVVSFNDRALAIYGYARDELLKLTIKNLRTPTANGQVADHMRAVRERGSMIYETEHRRKDGTPFPVEISARVIEADGRTFVQGVIRDLTEHRRSQQVLLCLNRLYAVLSAVHKAIMHATSRAHLFDEIRRVLKPEGDLIGTVIGTVDGESSNLAPVSPDERLGALSTSLLSHLVDAEVGEEISAVGAALRMGKGYFCNDVAREVDQLAWRDAALRHAVNAYAVIPLLGGGRPVGAICLFARTRNYFDQGVQDLLNEVGTEVSFALDSFERDAARVAAEGEAVRLLRERDRALRRMQIEFDSMPIACVVFDIDNHFTIREWNPAASLIFGYSRDEAIGRNVFELLVPDMTAPEFDCLLAGISASGAVISHTNLNTTKAGRAITCEWRNVALHDESGVTIGVLAMAQDVTPRAETERALKENEAMFRGLVEQSIAGIFIIEQGQIEYVNPRCAEIFGRTPAEMAGTRALDYVASEDRPTAERLLDDLTSGRMASVKFEFRAHRGDKIKVDVGVHAMHYSDQGAVIGILQDISERRRAQQELEFKNTVLSTQQEVSLDAILVVGEDGRVLSYNQRFVQLCRMPPDIVKTGVPDDRLLAYALDQVEDPKAFRDKVEELYAHQQEKSRDEIRLKDGRIFDRYSAPMINPNGRYLGRVWHFRDITESRKAEEQTELHLRQIERSMLGTIDAVSAMVELRDPYTSGHERRVGEIAAAIGVEMCLPDEEIKGLRIAGHVHDIGKIAIPAEILSKPTRLSKTEFEIIKTHAEQGYEILKSVEFPWPVAQVIRQHHERMDGSGYPQGLRGEAILLPARIMAVADTVEAMASHRPYRPGLGIDKALAEIERGSGVAYDSDVAAACLRLFREKQYQLPA